MWIGSMWGALLRGLIHRSLTASPTSSFSVSSPLKLLLCFDVVMADFFSSLGRRVHLQVVPPQGLVLAACPAIAPPRATQWPPPLWA